MKRNIHTLPPVRVNNFTNASSIIPKYWEEFLSINLQSDIAYGLYFNYATNYEGDYDFTIGSEEYFDNSQLLEIKPNCYKVFTCNMATIMQKWHEIWISEEKGELKRDYILDFEKHLPDGTIEIYIGIES